MKTIKRDKQNNSRLGVDGSTTTINGVKYPNIFKGKDINGGPSKGGSTKWEKNPVTM